MTISPLWGVSGEIDVTQSHFRDLPLLSQQLEAFPQTVLWYTPICLHISLNPVPSSTFALEAFSPRNCRLIFIKPSALVFFNSNPVAQIVLLDSYPKVSPQNFNGFDFLGYFADLLLLDIAIKEKATLASYSFSRYGLSWFLDSYKGSCTCLPPQWTLPCYQGVPSCA